MEGDQRNDGKRCGQISAVGSKKNFYPDALRNISWKPEYGPELEAINQELAKLRKVIDQEHENRRKRREAMQ